MSQGRTRRRRPDFRYPNGTSSRNVRMRRQVPAQRVRPLPRTYGSGPLGNVTAVLDAGARPRAAAPRALLGCEASVGRCQWGSQGTGPRARMARSRPSRVCRARTAAWPSSAVAMAGRSGAGRGGLRLFRSLVRLRRRVRGPDVATAGRAHPELHGGPRGARRRVAQFHHRCASRAADFEYVRHGAHSSTRRMKVQ